MARGTVQAKEEASKAPVITEEAGQTEAIAVCVKPVTQMWEWRIDRRAEVA